MPAEPIRVRIDAGEKRRKCVVFGKVFMPVAQLAQALHFWDKLLDGLKPSSISCIDFSASAALISTDSSGAKPSDCKLEIFSNLGVLSSQPWSSCASAV